MAGAERMPPDTQPQEPVFFESQQSLDGGGLPGHKRSLRKASFVQEPIHQVREHTYI